MCTIHIRQILKNKKQCYISPDEYLTYDKNVI